MLVGIILNFFPQVYNVENLIAWVLITTYYELCVYSVCVNLVKETKEKKNLITWKTITNNCIEANKTIFMLLKKIV